MRNGKGDAAAAIALSRPLERRFARPPTTAKINQAFHKRVLAGVLSRDLREAREEKLRAERAIWWADSTRESPAASGGV
jgi:hypothetical protein